MMKIKETIFNLPNEEYHRGKGYIDYLSSTSIKDYLISPKFARYKQQHPEDFEISAESAEKGSLYHDAMESMTNTGSLDKWRENLIVFDPPINEKTNQPYGMSTNKYQDALSTFQFEYPDKKLTSISDMELIETMVDQLLNHCRITSKQVKQILKWGKAEVSHFVKYQDCKFKYRPDVETTKKIIDWKTVIADDLHEDTIIKIIEKFHYGISAAFYQFFEHERTGIWKSFYWVFQQKKAPYDAIMVCADNFSYKQENGLISMGNDALIFSKLLEQHIYCTQNDDFDGAQIFIQPSFKDRRIMEPEPPMYSKNKVFNFYNK